MVYSSVKNEKGGSVSVPFCEKEEQLSVRKIFCKKIGASA